MEKVEKFKWRSEEEREGGREREREEREGREGEIEK
jgi:hypothetical protein